MNLQRGNELNIYPTLESTDADAQLQNADRREYFAQSLSDPDGADPRMSRHGTANDSEAFDWIGL